MLSDKNLRFLREKIQDLRSALFYSLSSSVLKIPTSIVTALKVDEAGQVWFFVTRPRQQFSEAELLFPARLEFYKKGKHALIKVNGRASIVVDEQAVRNLADLSEEVRSRALEQLLLIKVKIDKAEYYETDPPAARNSLKHVAAQLKRWLTGEPAGVRPYLLEPGY